MFFCSQTTGTVHFTAQNDDVSVSLKKTEKYRKNQMKLEKIVKSSKQNLKKKSKNSKNIKIKIKISNFKTKY